MNYEPGTRVAVLDASGKKFVGYGIYEGDFHCQQLAELYASCATTLPDTTEPERERLAAHILSGGGSISRNPRIRLDSGDILWGCECWWGPADEFVANGYAEKFGVGRPPEPRPAGRSETEGAK